MDFTRLSRELRQLLDLYRKGRAEGLSAEERARFLDLYASIPTTFQEIGWEPPAQRVTFYKADSDGCERFSFWPNADWCRELETRFQQAQARERELALAAPSIPHGEATGQQSPQTRRRDIARTLLDRAAAEEAALEAAHRLQVAQDAQRRAAIASWEQFRAFRADCAAGEDEPAREMARRICHFGRYLSPMGLSERLAAVVEDTATSDARRLAAHTLLTAAEGDVEEVVSLLRQMIANLWTIGLEARHELCEVLPGELLGVEPEPERPSGWEGSILLEPVRTHEDLIRWLRQTEEVESIGTDPERRQATADASLLRDAYRLADAVGVVRVPQQPTGPLSVEALLVALGNLRRAVREEAEQWSEVPPDEPPETADGPGGDQGHSAFDTAEPMDYGHLACRLRELLDIHAAHCPGDLTGERFERFYYLAVNAGTKVLEAAPPFPPPARFSPDAAGSPVDYFSELNVPHAPSSEGAPQQRQAITLLPCAAWRDAVAELAERAETRHRNHFYEPNESVEGFPLVAVRVRRGCAPAGLDLEATRKVAAGFTADWFLPADFAEQWRSWTFPSEPTPESIEQWRQLEEAAVTLSYRQNQEAGQRHLDIVRADLALIAAAGRLAQQPVPAEQLEPEQPIAIPTEHPWEPRGRAAAILRVMLREGWTSPNRKAGRNQIAEYVDERLKETDLSREFAELREHGCIIATGRGRAAGTHLTDKGVEFATRLEAQLG